MQSGKIVWDDKIKSALLKPDLFLQYGIRIPQVIAICHQLNLALTDNVEVACKNIKFKFGKTFLAKAKEKQCKQREMVMLAKIKNLHFSYKEKNEILHGVNLEINQGEIIALMGTNGAGKSTLLQQLVGILHPNHGKIEFDQTLVKGDIGFVMQNPDFMLFNRTVKDEILFGVRQLKSGIDNEDCIYQELVDKLSLEGIENAFPLSLSRGQRLRVAIAAVLSTRPKLLLLDEPTTGQDIAKIDDILTILKEYTAAGGTVIFCTHDTEIAAAFAKRILIMQEGKIIADGNAVDVFHDEKLLNRAGIKQPPVIKIAKLLGLTDVVSVKGVVLGVTSSAV